MKLNKIVVIIFILCSLQVGFSQEEKELKPLFEILSVIEQTFNIKFSYADNDIAHIKTAVDIKQEITLDQVLSLLETEYNLNFKKLNQRYYTISLKSKTVCGVVLDQAMQKPISGATIEVVSENRGVVTDENGFFVIKDLPKDGNLKIRYLGYKTYFITIDKLRKKPCETLFLVIDSHELDEVVVYHYLTTGLNKQKDRSITLNSKEFGILPGLIEPDVLQSIQALPGIKSINETVSNINIRGGSNDQNLVLWDGIKMYQSGHFFGLISAFNPHLTQQVSVLKNGTSAEFTDGVSGTINMKSINTLKNTFFGGAGFNLISGDAYGQMPITNKLSIQFSGRRSVTDFINTPTYNQYFNRAFQDSKITNSFNDEINKDLQRDETFYFYDFTGKLLYDINEKNTFRFSFINIKNDLTYAEILRQNGDKEIKESTLQQQNLAFGGSFTTKWSDSFKTLLNAYYTSYSLRATNLTLLTEQKLIQNNEVLETGLKLNTYYNVKNNLKLLNGYQLYEVGITNAQEVNIPAFKEVTKRVLRNHAIFSEVEYNSNNTKTYLRGGLRLNYIERFNEFIIEPRLSLSQNLGGAFSVEIQGEFKNQATNQIIDLEKDFLGVEKRRWILANNKDLPITKSKQISMAINFNKKNLYIDVEGFYKKVDGITTANQGFQNQNQFLGAPGAYGLIGSYEVKGIEFLINRKTVKYSTWLSYTYNVNDYTFASTVPGSFPNNFDIRHALTFAGTYTYNSLKLALGFNWRTGKPYTQPDANKPVTQGEVINQINYNSPNSSRIDDYIRVDLSFTYGFNMSQKIRATVGGAILNLLDKNNTLNKYYKLEDLQSTNIEQIENVSLGITPNVNFRMEF